MRYPCIVPVSWIMFKEWLYVPFRLLLIFEPGSSSRVACHWQVGVCRDAHYGCWWAARMHAKYHLQPWSLTSHQGKPWEFSTMQTSLLPTSPETRVLWFWVMVLPKIAYIFWDLLSRISRQDHNSIYCKAAAFSLQRQDSSKYSIKASSLLRFAVWRVEMGTVLTLHAHHVFSPLILLGGSFPCLEQFPHSTH